MWWSSSLPDSVRMVWICHCNSWWVMDPACDRSWMRLDTWVFHVFSTSASNLWMNETDLLCYFVQCLRPPTWPWRTWQSPGAPETERSATRPARGVPGATKGCQAMHESSISRFKLGVWERSNTGKLSESVSFLWTGVAGTKANSGAASERTTDGCRRPESWLEGDRKKEVETNGIF